MMIKMTEEKKKEKMMSNLNRGTDGRWISPTVGDMASLPRWAAERIRVLENNLADEQLRLRAMENMVTETQEMLAEMVYDLGQIRGRNLIARIFNK